MPKALVIRAAGTNCDGEMCRAFSMAGAEVDLVHLGRIVAEPDRIDEYDLIGFPGGFSYGDDIASGRIFAMRLRERAYPALRRAVLRGVPMIGACNGFQVLVQIGLLPGPDPGEDWPEEAPPRQRLALAHNIGARFIDQWIGMDVAPVSPCVWTRGLADRWPGQEGDDVVRLPIAHGEGRLVGDAPDLIPALEERGQVALKYRENLNGSEGAAAGVCDASGLVFGLMPHPERYLEWTRHPYWTRLDDRVTRGDTPGLVMFKSAVEAAAEKTSGSRV
jgi:phosphoribosylformylglycinamidine synthase subunit PurQ / glutaminase